MQKGFIYIGSLFLVFSSFWYDISGQELSTQGIEFYASFMKNGYEGCNGSEDNENLTIIASALRTCSVTIQRPTTGWSMSGTVPGGSMTTFTIPREHCYNTSSEIVTQLGLKITATDTISLFIANEATNSFDASIVLPTHALGSKYVTQNYTPSHTTSTCPSTNYSCFLIIATEDSTIVDITPRKNTLGGHSANIPFAVLLNEGECYQLFSAVGEVAGDLSGSKIESRDCKKIAVFNGNVLTGVPAGRNNGYDHIFEQAIPVNYWGRKFVVTAALNRSGDFVKITASENNTQVKVDGVVVATIQAQDSHEFFLSSSTGASFIETSMPCVTYLYNTTYSYDNSVLGDPSMIWIAPIEQQIDEIIFGTFAAQSISAHYVNIVVPTSSVASVRLDNSPLPASNFHLLTSNDAYSYARTSITHGTHRLACDQGFFAFIYGFGDAQGYGYATGARTVPFENDILVNQQPSKQIPEDYLYCPFTLVNFAVYSQYVFDSVKWILDDAAPVTSTDFTHEFTDSGKYTIKAIIDFTTSECAPPLIDTLSYEVHIGWFDMVAHDTACMGTSYNRYGFDFPVTRDTAVVRVVGTNYECDSTVVLHLVTHPFYFQEETMHIEIEELPYHYKDSSYTQAGDYTIHYGTMHGCDSSYLLHLIVHQDYLFSEEETICEGDTLLFRGGYYEEEGIYYDSLQTVLGDDSVYQLILHISPVYDILVEEEICMGESYIFNGNRLTATGTYIANLLTQTGCDSTVTLRLTVQESYFSEEHIHLCTPGYYYYRGDTLRESGTYIDTLQTVHGCDSILSLVLTLVDPSQTILEDIVCLGQYYRKNGLTIPPHSEAGEYEYNFTLADQYGCDSLVEITLTVPDARVFIVSSNEDFCDTYSTILEAITPNSDIRWNTGETTPSIEVNRPGIYQVVVSEDICQAKDSRVIDHCPFNIVLPNAISPGKKDGNNDYLFLANAAEIKSLNITIYDRWGRVVFYSTDPYFQWDGTVNGELIVNQHFNYTLFITSVEGKKYKLVGSILVM